MNGVIEVSISNIGDGQNTFAFGDGYLVIPTGITFNVGSSTSDTKKVVKLRHIDTSRKSISSNSGEDCLHGSSIVKRKAWDMDVKMEDCDFTV